MNKENKLKDYYKQKHWKNFVKDVLKPVDTRCEICGCNRWRFNRKKEKKINRVFNIHHKHYNKLYKEQRDDVQVLCRRCHSLCHDILKISSETNAVQDLKNIVRKYFIYNKENNDQL